MLKYKPWHTTQDNAWNDQPGTDEIYINSWKTFLETPFAKENVPDWSDELHSIHNEANDNASNEEPIQEAFEQEEWMHLADLIPGHFVDNGLQVGIQPDFAWQNDKHNYTEAEVVEMPSWIRTKKETLAPSSVIQQTEIDISTFSDMQRFAYNIIKSHLQQPCLKDPLLLIIIGVAGTGKRYLIHAIRNLLQACCAITVTTGKASYNIGGSTIHSLKTTNWPKR